MNLCTKPGRNVLTRDLSSLLNMKRMANTKYTKKHGKKDRMIAVQEVGNVNTDETAAPITANTAKAMRL